MPGGWRISHCCGSSGLAVNMRLLLQPGELEWPALCMLTVVLSGAGCPARVALQPGGGDRPDLGGDCEVPLLALVCAWAFAFVPSTSP